MFEQLIHVDILWEVFVETANIDIHFEILYHEYKFKIFALKEVILIFKLVHLLLYMAVSKGRDKHTYFFCHCSRVNLHIRAYMPHVV